MSEVLFSASWYRVAELRPRLRAHARIHRHSYRGQIWFVLQDFSTGRFHRFTPAAYRVIGLMDGRRSVDEIWRLACEELGDDAPAQDGMIRLLAQLHRADVLQSDVPPDTAELLERHAQQQRATWMRRLLSPFAIQLPLLDPEKLLERSIGWVRPLVSGWGVALWLALVLPALALAVVHFAELSEGLLDRVIAPSNLLLLWLLFPLIKAAHEFGHAYIAKAFGGEIHDMGVMFLVFTPVPYVDASSASAFSKRSQRVAVGAGGMLIELVLAALAMYVWASVEPGLVRSLAFNTMLIGGVTTLMFNANPLLRFDGYYIAADLLEIPNLRQRASGYVGYLLERYLLRQPEAEQPDAASSERIWLLLFAVSSFMYRMVVIFWIAFWVLEWSLAAGTALLAISAVGWVGMPLVKGIRFLARSPRIERYRTRAIGVAAGGAAVLLLLVGVLPMPLRTLSEGVVWIPDEANVRAPLDGFIVRVIAQPGEHVEPGTPLIELHDPALDSQIRALEAKVAELEARYAEQRPDNLVRANLVLEDLRYSRAALARKHEQASERVVRSRTSGSFVSPRSRDLPGRFARQGEQLAQVVDLETITVRTVLAQDDLDLVRSRLQAVEVRLAERVSEVLPAKVRRFVPGASTRLPSSALGSSGGGDIALDPRERDGVSALAAVFEVELELPASVAVLNAGGRVYVRFDLGGEPLVSQWYRRIRQLFLARLNV